MSGDSLMFLYGSPRSGTTWLGKILDAHPATLMRHEPDTIIRGDYPFVSSETFEEAARRHITELKDCHNPKVTGTRPVFQKLGMTNLAWFFRYLTVYGVKGLERILPVSIPLSIPDFTRDDRLSCVIKSVSLLGRMGSVYAACPNARYIHIIRHPCGHVFSVLRGRQEGFLPDGHFFAFADLPQGRKYDLTEEKVQAMTPLEQVSWRWAILNELAMDRVPEKTVLIYDKFCEDPMVQARNLLCKIGLGWHRQVEDFINYSRKNKDGFFDTRRDPVIAANRWKESFTDYRLVEDTIGHTEAFRLFSEMNSMSG